MFQKHRYFLIEEKFQQWLSLAGGGEGGRGWSEVTGGRFTSCWLA